MLGVGDAKSASASRLAQSSRAGAGAPSTAARERFVGRRGQLEIVRKALDRLERGSPPIITVSGEAGIGKTRLIKETLSLADQRDHIVLSGRAAEFERDLPFAAFADAVSDQLESSEIEGLDIDAETLGYLAAILPGLPGLGKHRAATGSIERHRSYQAVRSLLHGLSRERPLVLALDDLHWADEASVELLSILIRRRPQANVMLILAFRPHRLPDQLEAALVGAARENAAEQIDLPPLSREEAEQLLAPRVGYSMLTSVYREAGGNPFYLEQLARTLVSGEDSAKVASSEPSECGLPPLVAASISRELSSLDRTERLVLQGASILGDTFEPDMIAVAAGLDERATLDAIDSLLDLELIHSTDVARRFRFRHPLLRRAVYESASGGWRIAAHTRAAEELERRGANATLRARHVERSAKTGDERAVNLLSEAAGATTSRAPALAANWYEAALRLLPDTERNIDQRLELSVPLGIALASAGRLEQSREVLRNVLDRLPPELTPLREAALSSSTTVEILLGHHEAAKRDLVGALERLDDDRPEQGLQRAKIMGGIATACFFGGKIAEMADWAARAVERFGAERGPLPLESMGTLAVALYARGDIEGAREVATDAASMLDELSDEQLASRPACLLWLGWAETLIERSEEADRHFKRGVRAARDSGQEHMVLEMVVGQSLGLLRRGRLAEAHETLEPAVESPALASNGPFLTAGLALDSQLECLAGNGPHAVRLAERALEVSETAGAPIFRQLAITALAGGWLACGEPQRARDVLLSEIEQPALPTTKADSLLLLAQAELELGDLDAAEDWVWEAEHMAASTRLETIISGAQHARASLQLARGEHEEAVNAARRAAASAATLDAKVLEARAWLVKGLAHAGAGDRTAALDELGRAEAQLAETGAQSARAQAVRELRRLGRRVNSRGGGEGLAALTARELEVAKLAAEAKKNREIAAELFISEKTVEQHLGRVFSKLGLRSRVAIAAALDKLEDAG